ncbi:MAG: rhamnan synthesis F family protein [Bacteroidia bacterium]
MRSLCFFAAYFPGKELPYYVCVFLKELKKYHNDVVLICSQPALSEESKRFLGDHNIQLQTEANEGFDFGLWYKAFRKWDVSAYDRLSLVNDSCVLFRPLDEFMKWSAQCPAGLQGMTLSEAVKPHVQSYFLVLDKKAIALAKAYFEQQGIKKNIGEVIRDYEIGLSSYLRSNDVALAAFVDNNGYKGEFAPYFQCVDYHLSKGIPLIKKKILFASYRRDELLTLARMNFNIAPGHYVRLIKTSGADLILDIDKAGSEGKSTLSLFDKFRYLVTKRAIALFRPLYKALKK